MKKLPTARGQFSPDTAPELVEAFEAVLKLTASLKSLGHTRLARRASDVFFLAYQAGAVRGIPSSAEPTKLLS